MFNGLGAQPDNYNTFITQTFSLYRGGMTQALYRNSLTATLGSGSFDDPSFNCIFAHLPAGNPAKQ